MVLPDSDVEALYVTRAGFGFHRCGKYAEVECAFATAGAVSIAANTNDQTAFAIADLRVVPNIDICATSTFQAI